MIPFGPTTQWLVDTLAENVALGPQQAAIDEVQQQSRQLGLESFVQREVTWLARHSLALLLDSRRELEEDDAHTSVHSRLLVSLLTLALASKAKR